jgi:Type II CAAX prenyl endopeptidase Rce1-like
MRKRLRGGLGYAWGLLLFWAIEFALRFGLGLEILGSAARSLVILETTLLVVALLGWKLVSFGRPFREMGWRRAAWWSRSYLPWFGVAAAVMTAGSAATLLIHPVAPEMHFYELVLLGWRLGSFAEEFYVRGLVQSWIAGPEDSAGNSVFAPSIVWSTLLFGAMHWPLFGSPENTINALIVLFGMLGVGWCCAVLRARTKSLLPAILCHLVGNIATVLGGFLGVILYCLIHGHLPDVSH